jgi:phosphopantetheinyl transferase (holo-ACP synthase)
LEQQEIDSLSVAFDNAHWDELRGHKQQIIADFSAKEAISKGRGTGFLVDPKTIKLETDEFIVQQHFQIKDDENYIISLCSNGKPNLSFDKLNKLCKFVTNYED